MEKQTLTCTKCKAQMIKKGTMDSGNSKFDVFRCTECDNEKMVCKGVN